VVICSFIEDCVLRRVVHKQNDLVVFHCNGDQPPDKKIHPRAVALVEIVEGAQGISNHHAIPLDFRGPFLPIGRHLVLIARLLDQGQALAEQGKQCEAVVVIVDLPNLASQAAMPC
jgi:hypothetical protein